MADLPETCTCHWRDPAKCEIQHHRLQAAMGYDVYANRNTKPEPKSLTEDDVEAMCQLLRSLATLSTITTPTELVDAFITNVVGVYDEQEVHHTNKEWDELTSITKDKLTLKSLLSALLDYPYAHESPKRAVISMARIYLEPDELSALAVGDDPLKQKMKRIRTRREQG